MARRAAAEPKTARGLRGDLDTIVLKALKKSPVERYPSVTAFADDIRRYLSHETVSARPDSLGYRAAKFVRRNRLAVGLSFGPRGRYEIAPFLQHVSNAKIKLPNDGLTYFGVTMRFALDPP